MVNNKINSNIKGIKTFRPKLTQVIFTQKGINHEPHTYKKRSKGDSTN
jgi:hypothetical protein